MTFVDAAFRRILWESPRSPHSNAYGLYVDRKLSALSRYAGDQRSGIGVESALLVYRDGIATIQAHCLSKHGVRFQQLASWRQNEVLAFHEWGAEEERGHEMPDLFRLMLNDAAEAYFDTHNPWTSG